MKWFIIVYAIITSGALVALKYGSKDGPPVAFSDGSLSLHLNWIILLGVLLYGVSFLLYTFLVSTFNLGYIIPISTALVYILIFTTSFFLFKEHFSLVKIFAITLIFVGILLLSWGGSHA